MEKAVKDGGCSPFSQLPDDIVVQIYNKIMDLKTLCYCQLISKRLGLLVFQADTISFNVPLPIDYENENLLDDLNVLFNLFRFPIGMAASAGALDDSDSDSDPAPLLGLDSFLSAINFIKRFTKLKSLCIQFPSYITIVAGFDVDGRSLFGWKIKLCARADSLVIQALNSEDTDEEREDTDEDKEEKDTDYCKTLSCLMNVIDRLKKVLGCIVEFPLLESIFIMGSNERGIVTLSGGEIDKLRNLLHSYGTSTSEHLVYHSGEISDSSSG